MTDALLRRDALRRLAITLALGLAVVLAAMGPQLAHGAGRAGPPPPSLYAPAWREGAPAIAAGQAWGNGSRLVAEAARWVGSGKFTSLPGAWCADAVSVWLKATGRPPLANRLAASALAYGTRDPGGQRGDLVVMRTNRGPAGHVGVVEAVEPDGSIAMISGNVDGRVARTLISRASVTAFVTP